MNKTRLFWFLGVVITVFLCYVLISNISFNAVKKVLGNISIIYIFLGFVFHFLAYIFRTLRFHLTINDGDASFKKLFYVHTLHNFFNQILPGGVGELSLPVLLRKYTGNKISTGTALIMSVRICDIAILLTLFFLSISLGNLQVNSEYQKYLIILSVLSISLAIVLFLFLFYSSIFTKNRFVKKLYTNRILLFIKNTILEFAAMNNKKKLIKIIFYSCLSNVFVILVFWSLLNGFGISLNFFEVAFTATVLIPVYILPLRGVAGLGTTEGGWALSLWLLGINKEIGISAGFAIHIITLFYVLVLATYGFISLNINRK